MIRLPELIAFHAMFQDAYGVGRNLLSYLSRPRITHVKNFQYDKCYNEMLSRTTVTDKSYLGHAPQDDKIFVVRYALMFSNNDFYRLAVKDDPTVEDLETYSLIDPKWSTLFPLKHYLMHHMEKAKAYRGLLPFGGAVKSYFNKLGLTQGQSGRDDNGGGAILWNITGSPTYADHVMLQKVTNEMADAMGMPSVTINNVMYLHGKKARPTNNTTTELEDIPAVGSDL